MDQRIIEVIYDIASISGVNPIDAASPRLLRFRDRALAGLETCLGENDLGYPIGAEIDAGELTLRAVVHDFAAAEERLPGGLDDVACGGYREMLRYWGRAPAV